MKFLIIIPVHNEEKNISFCLKSLEYQTFSDFDMILVNDGSTDRTQEKIEQFVSGSSIRQKIKVIRLGKSGHEPGAKVVRTFNTGLQAADLTQYDVICKFDADIIFPENYLEQLNDAYETQPKAGMVSGIVKIKKEVLDYSKAFDFTNSKMQWKFEDISSRNHVRGPIKSYRKKCFEDMQGLRPVLGWDNIDVLLARMHGWEIITIKNLWVKHLRPTAYQYKNQRAEKLGQYFYNIGLNVPLMLVSALKASWKNRSVKDFCTIVRSFLKQNHPIVLSEEEIHYIRRSRTDDLLRKLKRKTS
ncbi:glycosyltransferase family 2 protein [Daejeonia sp. YH14]|uniref:glycosyltransferase family 2 protein n=1 Tax=Daejeonia sp. YH14 TaxID=3439042 RepID=UPI003F49323A